MRIAFDVEFGVGIRFHERGEGRDIGCFDVALIGARVDGNAVRARVQDDSGTIKQIRQPIGAAVAQQRDPIYVTGKMRHAILEANDTTQIVQQLGEQGFASIPAAQIRLFSGNISQNLHALEASWNDLPRDGYLRDGGKYRSRRHSSYIQHCASGALELVKHRAHWQPTDYNALHGGIERWFEPIAPHVNDNPAWRSLIVEIGNVFSKLKSVPQWFIETHQFRIDTAEGVGRPTPEGAHRDGVDFVAVILVQRGDVRGGESRVFEAEGPNGVRFTLSAPWTTLLLDDARVIHETTPIQPGATQGVRDTLVLTYRAGSFQDPA
jgi:hypothetical protein